MIDYTGTYTDQYQLAMAQAYFVEGRKDEVAVFDYFFRKLPFDGGYAVFAGLKDLLDALENLRFDDKDIAFLRDQGMDAAFLDYLQDFKFTGTVSSTREGDVVFPILPVVTVEAPIIEAQIVETLLLNILNYPTLIATKASRMCLAAVGNDAQNISTLVDFGLRRSPGLGGYSASRACVIGGFDATSNVRAARDYGLTPSGTMAHSFIQSYDNELTAFRAFAAAHPDNTVLLVDTYDTLKSGVPNAVTVGKEMEERGQSLKGIRLDSGDLAWLSRQARKMLDNAGLQDVKIAASNQLDEHVIKSLREQGAPIDLYGVGTALVTGRPDGALDGVYKLAEAGGKPRIKLSETREKITLPSKKQVYRVFDSQNNFFGADVASLEDEDAAEISHMHHPSDPHKSLAIGGYKKEPLLNIVMKDGKRMIEPQKLTDIKDYSRKRLALLPAEYKRFDNPHIYKTGLSDQLKKHRDKLIADHKAEAT